MGMFQQAKDMYKLQKEAKTIKKELANIHIEAEEDGVIVTINAEMEVMDVKISDEALQNKVSLEKSLVKAFNKGLKKGQEIAAEKMKGVMSMMGMGAEPGAIEEPKS
ncbi:MAG: YbaB/EbfC family nucleoid-associated protein [Candidatus Gracilibacteria bacterium]|nr:YbaB/EbfC family nucleoid-associated protein [Candidatus Gracilibacteria bacterium]